MWDGAIYHLLLASVPSKIITIFCILYTSHLYLRPPKAGDSWGKAELKCQQESEIFFIYFILYSENQCISKLDKIGIFIDMKFH